MMPEMGKSSIEETSVLDRWEKRPLSDPMTKPTSYRELIALWPSRSTFASDLGVSLARVHKWALPGGNIRAEFFLAILEAARRRDLSVSATDLCHLAAGDAERSDPRNSRQAMASVDPNRAKAAGDASHA